MEKLTKIRREKAPNEGYNFMRFLEKYTLRELERLTLRQLFDAKDATDVARREVEQ